jgi:hypothetical protein
MSESQVRSILQSVATGDLSPAEAATLLDALSADDQAEPAAAAFPAAEATPAAAAAPPVPPVPPVAPVPPVPPVEAADAPPPPPPPLPGSDETQEVHRPVIAGGSAANGRGEVVVNLNGRGSIDVVCDAGVTEPYADGPNTVTVERSASGFTVSGDVGDDSVVMLPNDLDLTISVNGDGFSLVGLVGTVSADLNCGDVAISGVFAQGDSRIHANTGDIDLTFLTGSDVEVIANAPSTLNADGLEHVGRGRWSLGAGTAKLNIDGNVGGINLRTG